MNEKKQWIFKRIYISLANNTSYRSDELVAMLPGNEKSFFILGEKFLEMSNENNVLKFTVGDFDKNC